jgi:hypothetical protein
LRKVVVATYRPATPYPAHLIRFDPVFEISLNDVLLVRLLFGIVSVFAFPGFRSAKKLEVKLLFKSGKCRTPIFAMSDRCLDVENLFGNEVVRKKIDLSVVAVDNLDVWRGETTATNPEI